jgi:hypothetical protein
LIASTRALSISESSCPAMNTISWRITWSNTNAGREQRVQNWVWQVAVVGKGSLCCSAAREPGRMPCDAGCTHLLSNQLGACDAPFCQPPIW